MRLNDLINRPSRWDGGFVVTRRDDARADNQNSESAPRRQEYVSFKLQLDMNRASELAVK